MIEHRDFTAIMGAFPTGVIVVTALDGAGMPHGATLNAFSSVSADPPLLLVCLAHSSRTLAVLRERRRFAVNFLASGGGEVSAAFASKREDKFEGVAWRATELGNPLLHADTVAFAECELHSETTAGDHAVVLGRVVAGQGPSQGARPLVYFRRDYHDWPPIPRNVPGGSKLRAVNSADRAAFLETDR